MGKVRGGEVGVQRKIWEGWGKGKGKKWGRMSEGKRCKGKRCKGLREGRRWEGLGGELVPPGGQTVGGVEAGEEGPGQNRREGVRAAEGQQATCWPTAQGRQKTLKRQH